MIKKILFSVPCLILSFCLLGYWTNRQLELTEIELEVDDLPKNLLNTKILHVSDIHYGHLKVPLKKLLKEARQAKPDLILITGDTIDRTEDITLSGIQALVNQFADIAPTYVIEGNHETSSGQLQEWRQFMIDSRATLLENQVITIPIKGQGLTLIGLRNGITDLPDSIKETVSREQPALILAHHPETYNDYLHHFQDLPIKGIFSGHAHGGQVRLPFIDGLLAPNQGVFPHYTNGPYTNTFKPETTLFVSRGLSNSSFPFRINNKPHLISVTLTKK